jgi:hypothetical protein
MGHGNEDIQRRFLVCAMNKCEKCPLSGTIVPKKCKWRILHLFETREGGTQVRDRKSGKTTELLEIARVMAEAGRWVYYISVSGQMADIAKSRMNHPNIRFMGISQAFTHMRGMPQGMIVVDDVPPENVTALKRVIPEKMGYYYLAHYWTPRP